MFSRGSLAPHSHLDALLVRAPQPPTPHRLRGVRIPGVGRVLFTRDQGDGKLVGNSVMMTNLHAILRGPNGKIKELRNLGSGLVTNAGVNLMSNDYSWTTATLKAMNYHAIGTGTNAAAASDVWLQTANGATNLSGTTNGYMTGTQSIIANSTSTPWSPIYQTVATFTFTGAVAVTEWVLCMGNFANVTHTSTATTSTTLADTTNNPFTSSMVMATIETGSATPINTPTTTPMLQIASQVAGTATGLDNSWSSGTKSWLSIANQAVATPGAASTYVVFPTAWDHKVFAVINAANGDTLQFTYQLSINSGG